MGKYVFPLRCSRTSGRVLSSGLTENEGALVEVRFLTGMGGEGGLPYLLQDDDRVPELAAALDARHASVKKKGYELLSALCAHSTEGYQRALQVLQHCKVRRGYRYRFEAVVEVLRSEQLVAAAAFLNAAISGAASLQGRMAVRNELIGLNFLDVIHQLRSTHSGNSDSDLIAQLDAFEEQRYTDEGQLTGSNGVDLSSHQDVFYAVLRQVSRSPHEPPFLSLLQHLLRVDASQPVSDAIWNTAEKLVHRATLCETKGDAEKLLRTPGYLHISGSRCQCSCHSDKDVRTRKRTLVQLQCGEGSRPTGVLSPTHSSPCFNPELLASISPPPTVGVESAPRPSLTTSAPPPPPPPPPPPGAGVRPVVSRLPEVELPQQATPRPRSKMRSLNWTKIPSNKVVGKSNLWSLIAQAHDGSANDMDFDAMEGLFCQQANGQASPSLGRKTDSLNRKKRESAEINLLDGKRSLNVNIFLKQFRSCSADVVALVQAGAHAQMGSEKLRGLLKVLPDSDEIELLRSYEGDRQKLGDAERFVLQLIELPNYKLRCEAMLLEEEFPANMAFLEPAIESIVSAVQELKNCKELHEVLYILLVAGNFLNSGGYAGDAAGFKMMSLLKVAETRGNRPGVSLIHYVAQEAERKLPSLLNFPEYLASLEDVSKLSIDNLKNEIANLSQKVSKISQQVATAGKDVRQQTQDFLQRAACEVAASQRAADGLEAARAEMADFLCEETSTFKLEECFRVFHAFCTRFRGAVQDNERRRQQERRAEARRRQREDAPRKRTAPAECSGSESDATTRAWGGPSEEEAFARALESPDVTPDRRRRQKVCSEDNLMDFLRQSADEGSLRRSRRGRPDILPSDLIDRERPASPASSPMVERRSLDKPKQWRRKIEEWLHENDSEQKLRDRIALERWRRQEQRDSDSSLPSPDRSDEWKRKLHDSKTDSELYEREQGPPGVPPKDKSRWRKSSLNVANSSESVDDERRRKRGRRLAAEPQAEDTISFYIRTEPPGIENDATSHCGNNLPPDNLTHTTEPQKPSNEKELGTSSPMDTTDMAKSESLCGSDYPTAVVGRSRFCQSMKEPPHHKRETELIKVALSDDETLNATDKTKSKLISTKKSRSRKDDTNSAEEDEARKSSGKDDDGNFDRFSFMRKTTRRTKPRQKNSESECKKSQEDIADTNSTKITDVANSHSKSIDPENCSIEVALRDINQASKEIRALNEENSKISGGLFSKNNYEKRPDHIDDQLKKDKTSTSLKARLSKRLLSLTENLKAGPKVHGDPPAKLPLHQKSQDFLASENNKVHSSRNQPPLCPVDTAKIQIENEKCTPMTEQIEKTALKSYPRTEVQSHMIPLPKPMKETYDTNQMKIVYATPIGTDRRSLHSISLGKDEHEKDEGFEESQLSEVAGSCYDTDLADSPKSPTETRRELESPKRITAHNSIPTTEETTVKNDAKRRARPSGLDSPSVSRASKRESSVNNSEPELPIKSHHQEKLTKCGVSGVNKAPQLKPDGNRRLNPRHDPLTGQTNKIVRVPSLRSSARETSPKIGRRVAVYTKAIKSMTHNLRGSKRFENYDDTQSMPPTPTDEAKSLASSLSGDRRRSTSSAASGERWPSDRSLSRKSSEASVVTVKSIGRSPSDPPRRVASNKPMSSSTTKPVVKPRSAVMRSCGFMKATSASTAKTSPVRRAWRS